MQREVDKALLMMPSRALRGSWARSLSVPPPFLGSQETAFIQFPWLSFKEQIQTVINQGREGV